MYVCVLTVCTYVYLLYLRTYVYLLYVRMCTYCMYVCVLTVCRLKSLLFAVSKGNLARSRNICSISRAIARVGHARFREIAQLIFNQYCMFAYDHSNVRTYVRILDLHILSVGCIPTYVCTYVCLLSCL